ncbi:hypothetical protein PM082_009271 [Marasmius tenuissimus]|nr:hypothetical protein PM082_009271 [Marasmius tenuissimus]
MSSAAHRKERKGSVGRPTIFSTLTRTPIAFADNVWSVAGQWTGENNLVERKVLDNGLTRFQLGSQDEESFLINLKMNGDSREDVEKAWLSQALSIFYARGIPFKEDLSVYELVYPCVAMNEHFNRASHLDTSKSQQRRQQPIYLFVRPPPFNLPGGETCNLLSCHWTSSLHFWSFDKDGCSPLSANICSNFGLPFKLRFFDCDFLSHSWSTENYHLIHQYQLLRGADPTTTNFARPLGYGFTFQSVSDSDRFTEAHGEEDANHPKFADVPASSLDSESSLGTQDHRPVSGAIFKGNQDQGAAEDPAIVRRPKTNAGFRGIETYHYPVVEDLCHENNTATSRSLQPPLAISLLCAGASNMHSLEHVHSRQMHQSEAHPHSYADNQKHFPYPYLSQNFSPGYPLLSTPNMPAPMDFNSLSMGCTPAGWPGIPQYIFNQSPIPSSNIAATRHSADIAQIVGWPLGMSHVASPTVANTFYNRSLDTVAPTRPGMPQFMTMVDPSVASSSFKAGSANLDNMTSANMSNPVYTDPTSNCLPTNAAQTVRQSGLALDALAGNNIVDDADTGPPGDSRGSTSHREERSQPLCSLTTSATKTSGVADVIGWTSPVSGYPNFFPLFITFLQTYQVAPKNNELQNLGNCTVLWALTVNNT